MFKKFFVISFIVCATFTATRSDAQQGSQPLFAIVDGSGATASRNAYASVTLPVLGFVQDQSGGLRPLIGITGAASVGAPLGLGFPVVQAAMPPSHDYILAIAGGSGWPVLLQVRGNTITVQPLLGKAGHAGAVDLSATIDSIATSPTGSTAGLLSQSQGRIYAFGNLSQTPVLSGTFDTSVAGTVSAFGISDDGSTVILGGSSPNSGSLYLISSGQGPQLVGSVQHPAAVQFLRNSSNAIVADDAGNTIFQVTNGQLYAIAAANDGIATPAGIGISNDNQRVFVGNSASGAVTTISLSGAAAQSLPCNCTLTGIQPTSADSVFQVTGFSGGPISLFDGGSATSRMIFVPVRP